MKKMILKDGSEIQIRDGAGLLLLVTDIGSYDDIKDLAAKLTPGNLTQVQFAQESGEVTAVYTDMMLMGDCLTVSVGGDQITATFGIRERTLEERQQADVTTAIAYLSDEQAVTVKDLYPEWLPDSTHKTGDRVQYEDKLYKCLSDHTAQPEWTPDAAPSLWAEILTRPGEILPWKQPDSTNPYHRGDKVTHKGQTWESDIDNNVWEPGAVGTEALWHVVEE